MKHAIVLAAIVSMACGTTRRAERPAARCVATQSCWPSPEAWDGLRARLRGKLVRPASRADALRAQKNPFALQDDPAATQSSGWLDAWTAAPSAYAVVAAGAQDIAAAVDFAREHRLRLVVKGTGHDYLGRSSAPGSLLVWTHEMRDLTLHDTFVAAGCTGAGVAAISVGAGTRWIEIYRKATVENRRYVQGGGCTSVGAAGGFTQGGGFGSWSKKFGTAAGNVLEAEVVTADGKRVIANACQNQDLFWALRGGGGGTFGIVSRLTMRTHPLPSHVGFVIGSIEARSDESFRELLEQFLVFHREHLGNESWGEQVSVRGDNSLQVSISFQGMSAEEAERAWRPLRAWIDQRPGQLTMKLQFLAVPTDRFWDRATLEKTFPDAIRPDDRPLAREQLFYWATNQDEVATYWYTYQSRWIPRALFEDAHAARFAAALFDASRHWAVDLHFNKGLAGAAPDALARNRETSMNPAVERAAALAILAASGEGKPGVPGHEPDTARGQAEKARVTAAMTILRRETPDAGTYVNETDYFEPDWQRTFWGEHYPRLLEIKRKVDPSGLFTCHHCVGSEEPRR